VIALLARRGFAIDAALLHRDFAQPHRSDASVRAAWLAIYRDTAKYWELYELAEELVDLEDWSSNGASATSPRSSASSAASRERRHRRGLLSQGALDIRFFPELWEVRTEL